MGDTMTVDCSEYAPSGAAARLGASDFVGSAPRTIDINGGRTARSADPTKIEYGYLPFASENPRQERQDAKSAKEFRNLKWLVPSFFLALLASWRSWRRSA